MREISKEMIKISILDMGLKITNILLQSCHPGANEINWCVDVRDAQIQGMLPLQWRQNGRDSVSNHQPRDCLLNRLFRRRSKKTSKLRVTGLCVGNSPGTGEFSAQTASNAENVSIWWRHHGYRVSLRKSENLDTKSREIAFSHNLTQLFWNVAQNTTRMQLWCVHIFKTICQLKWLLWTKDN